jgi:hypothetical protein
MEVEVQLTDLHRLHEQLDWYEFIAAAAIVLGDRSLPPFWFDVEVIGLPTFDGDGMQLKIYTGRLNRNRLAKRRRTFEPSRLVEHAAIALAGLALYHCEKREKMTLAFMYSWLSLNRARLG